jgi:L-lysine exporter family protein LysE/ArgO
MIFFHGFLLGLSLITALGPQNLFLIRQGVSNQFPIWSATICYVCDSLLVILSVLGLHTFLIDHINIQIGISLFGIGFLVYYGQSALRRSLYGRMYNGSTNDNHEKSLKQIILLSMGFSLLNPHAIIDSVIIVGGGSAQFPDNPIQFTLGVMTAGLIWFYSLVLMTRLFASTLSKPPVWRAIEGVSGTLMLYIGVKLIFYVQSLMIQ